MLEQGQHVRLTALPSASRRTKNRINERGGRGFRVMHEPTATLFDNEGRKWVQLMSACGWNGWLPVDEVESEEFEEASKA